MRLAYGLENHDNMVRHGLSVSMVIEALRTTKLYFLLESDAAMQH